MVLILRATADSFCLWASSTKMGNGWLPMDRRVFSRPLATSTSSWLPEGDYVYITGFYRQSFGW